MYRRVRFEIALRLKYKGQSNSQELKKKTLLGQRGFYRLLNCNIKFVIEKILLRI